MKILDLIKNSSKNLKYQGIVNLAHYLFLNIMKSITRNQDLSLELWGKYMVTILKMHLIVGKQIKFQIHQRITMLDTSKERLKKMRLGNNDIYLNFMYGCLVGLVLLIREQLKTKTLTIQLAIKELQQILLLLIQLLESYTMKVIHTLLKFRKL